MFVEHARQVFGSDPRRFFEVRAIEDCALFHAGDGFAIHVLFGEICEQQDGFPGLGHYMMRNDTGNFEDFRGRTVGNIHEKESSCPYAR